MYSYSHNVTTGKNKLCDYKVLAESCRRAGKHAREAVAHYSRGVLYDNMEEHAYAIKCYEKYLNICLHLGDAIGCALAYNSIAIAYYMLGTAKNTSRDEGEEGDDEYNMAFLENAVRFHGQHMDVADDRGQCEFWLGCGRSA